jgi:hypothetical protein
MDRRGKRLQVLAKARLQLLERRRREKQFRYWADRCTCLCNMKEIIAKAIQTYPRPIGSAAARSGKLSIPRAATIALWSSPNTANADVSICVKGVGWETSLQHTLGWNVLLCMQYLGHVTIRVAIARSSRSMDFF